MTELLEICEVGGYRKLAMPLIGCGLDKLDWSIVESMIKKVFEFANIEIMVCKI